MNKTYEFIKELLGPDATELEIEEAIANLQRLFKTLGDMAERRIRDENNPTNR